MGKFGLSVAPAESTVKQIVQRQRWQPLFTTNYVGNLHQVVIHDIGQVIGGQAVCRFIQHFIVQRGGVDGDIASDQVMHVDLFVFGHFETNHPLVSTVDPTFHFISRQGQ